MLKIAVFIPETHCESVKRAMFAAGAGRIGEYDCCAWQVLGEGQFRPLDAAKPYIGQVGVIESVDEYRVEMVCPEELLDLVIDALMAAHPYEEPAFDVWQLYDL